MTHTALNCTSAVSISHQKMAAFAQFHWVEAVSMAPGDGAMLLKIFIYLFNIFLTQ